jgi:hypothetical protein
VGCQRQNTKGRYITNYRHGPREGGSFPSKTTSLSEDGRFASLNFGTQWDGPEPNCIVVSPVPRCCETGKLIKKGANWEINVYESNMLGDHGPFVVDPELFEKTMKRSNCKDLMYYLRRHIDGYDVPGMLHRDLGSKKLLSDLTYFNGREGLTLAISHDSIIAAILASDGNDAEPWPEPLCGAVIKWSMDRQEKTYSTGGQFDLTSTPSDSTVPWGFDQEAVEQ